MVRVRELAFAHEPIEHRYKTARIPFEEMPIREPVEETQSRVGVVMDLKDFGDVVGFEFGG